MELHGTILGKTAAGLARGAVTWLVIASVCLAGPHALAQATGEASQPASATQPNVATSQPASTQPSTNEMHRLTLDEVQLRLRQAQTNPDIDEGEKATLVGLYSQAIQQLQLSEQCAAVASRHDAERLKVPQLLSAAHAELENPPPSSEPDVPADAPVSRLEEVLAQMEAELEHAWIAQSDLMTQRDRNLKRRLDLPALLTTARRQLATLVESSDTAAETNAASAMSLARHTLIQARRIALETEIQRYEKEMLNFTARRELFSVRLELARRHVADLEAEANAWRARLRQQRRSEIEQAYSEVQKQAEQAPTPVKTLAEACLKLAAERRELCGRLEQVEDRARDLATRLAGLRGDLERIEKRVQASEVTTGLSELLHRDRARLPDILPHMHDLDVQKGHTGDVRRRMTELEELSSTLADGEQTVRSIRTHADPNLSKEETAEIDAAAREWAGRQQKQVDALLEEYGVYFSKLIHLDAREQEFVDAVRRIAAYTDANLLWGRSCSLPGREDLTNAVEAIVWLSGVGDLHKLAATFNDSINAQGVLPLVALLVLVMAIALRRRLWATLVKSGEFVLHPGKDSLFDTAKALACTVILAALWPAAIAWCAWLASPPGEVVDFARGVSAGLLAAAVVLLTTRWVSVLVCPNGLGERHFRWRAARLQLLRRHLRWLPPIVVPAVFIFATLGHQAVDTRNTSLGRAAFIVSCLAVAVFVHKLLRPGAGLWAPIASGQKAGLGHLLHHVVHVLAIAVPLALAVASVFGYYYTAIQLGWKLLITLWCFLALLIVDALLRRWLVYKMQRRALREAQERAAKAAQHRAEGATEPAVATEAEPGVDLADIRVHTSRLVRTAMAVAAGLCLWMVWANVLPALEPLRGIVLWTNHVETADTITLPDGSSTVSKVARALPVTLSDLCLAIAVISLTIIAARNLPGLLEVTLLDRLPLAASSRYAFATITGYLITVVGIILAFSAIGIGWSRVQWLAAAMTVGLGFGLQEIFANFVSGLIILFERPVRIGDAVTIGDQSGVVTRIRMRATTITNWDHKELIVPNKRFITEEVLNWTLTDSVIRLVLPISVAHGSNPAVVRDTLVQIAKDHAGVLSEPAPSAVFKGLGPSSMDFELSVFVHREDYGRVLHELNSAVEESLVAKGIGIAVPIQLQQIQVRAVADNSQPVAAAG
ncbi:MAG TPA: mechanosensitive ion channel domain-containing protein [Phycisphaerae bacterium]|nr:mechanosensitive ion channel domain-containing protein [Phycisphaerae bacterium]